MAAGMLFSGTASATEHTNRESKADTVDQMTVYVSQTGDDAAGDGTQTKPYGTIDKAETVIERAAVAAGRIVISGEVQFRAAAHEKRITITGDGDAATKLIIGDSTSKPVNISGPTIMEKIQLRPKNKGQNAGLLQTGQEELVLGQGVVMDQYSGYLRVGADLASAGDPEGAGSVPTLTIDSLSHNNVGSKQSNYIRIGTGYGNWMNGVMVTVNGGTIEEMNIHRQTQFSKDVNFVFNGGTVKKLTTSFNTIPGTTEAPYQFKQALQIVFNNGMRIENFEKELFDKISDNGGKWYLYGAEGGSLSTTETAGTFKVNGEKFAKATLKSDPTKVYYGNPGDTLTVPAGEYDVTYVDDMQKKNILYIKSDGTADDCIIQDVNIQPGVQYTVSYDYKVVNGQINENGAYLVLKGGAGFMNGNKTYRNSFKYDKVQKFDAIEDNGMRVKCTFTLSEGEVDSSGNYKIGFYFHPNDAGKSAEFYIANFKVYAASDEKQKNLLWNDGSKKDMHGWHSNWRSAAEGSEEFGPNENLTKYTAKYVDYDASYFKPMFHVIDRGEGNPDLMQNVSLEKGKTYTVSFKYKFVTGYENYSVYFAVGKEAPQKVNSPVYYYQSNSDSNMFDKVVYGTEWSEIAYVFTMNDDRLMDGKNACSVGFRFIERTGCSTEIYIADMVLYETNSAEKTNLLSVSNCENGMYGWHGTWRSAAKDSMKFQEFEGRYNIAAYVPYEERYFKKVGYGDANEDAYIDVLDLVRQKRMLKANTYSPYADSNKDGVLTEEDLSATRKHLVCWEEIQNLIIPYKVQNGGAQAQTDILKKKIKENKDSIFVSSTGNTYYVDAIAGNDANSGTDKDKPLKTISKVNTLALNTGDVVLFKRNTVFRIAEPLKVRNGVKYGTYGTGEKPQFLGSLKDYGKAAWIATGTEGVWRLNEDVAGEAGVVTFDGDTAVGNRVLSLDKLRKNGDYYHNYRGDGSFYLYLKDANPTEYFNHIEIGTTKYLIRGLWQDEANGIKYAKQNVQIENIVMMYCSDTAMDFAHSKNISIKGCEFMWVGGAYKMSENTSYGNAVTLWCDNSDITIESCLFYQIYDAAVTFQGNKPSYSGASESETRTEYKNLVFTNLLIEYSSMNFEYWGSNSSLWKGADQIEGTSDDRADLKPVTVMSGICFKDSMIRFGGYGFGGMNRQYKSSQGCLLGWNSEYYDTDTIENFKIYNNIFDSSDCYIFYSPLSLNQRITISDNTYYQGKSSYRTNHGSDIVATNQQTLEQAIKTFETSPKKIQWIE